MAVDRKCRWAGWVRSAAAAPGGRILWCLPALLLASLWAAPGCQRRQPYPDRPIVLICPWSVGGGTDRISRQVAAYLERDLGVPVNVVNATGGQGVTGHSRGLRARPDGYTITMMTVELNMLHWQGLTEISWRDAAPLMLINQDAAAVFVRREAPWRDMNDLLEAVRRRPGELTASGTATGGIWHLALGGWLEQMGRSATDINWIPMGGAGPSLQELISGGLDLVSCSLPEARTLFRSGEVRCLGVMADDRVPGYEQVPTLSEQGMDWTMVGWRGLGAPAETPPQRLDVLTDSLQRVVTGEVRLNGRTFPQFMENEGFNHQWMPPEPFAEFLAENDQKFGRLLTEEPFSQIGAGPIPPMAFPTVILTLMGFILIALAIRRAARGRGDQTADLGPITAAGITHAALALLAVVAYLLLAEMLGFMLTMGLLMALLMWRLGARLWVAAAVALLLTPGVYYIFAVLLRVPLPRGWIGM